MTKKLWPALLNVAALLGAGATLCPGQYLETVVGVGDSPIDIVWSPLVNKVFCANSQDASITVISGETNEVLSTIMVGDYPTFLCLNGDGSKVYCTRGEDNKLVVIDAAAESVLKVVDIPYFPLSMAYNATMDKLYISCNDDPVYRITVLDAAADTVMRYIPVLGVGRLLWSPASNRVFCYTDWGEDTVKAVDCETDEIASRVPVDGGGYQLGDWCFNPVNNLVYLSARYGVHVYTTTGDSEICAVPGRAGAALTAARFTNKLLAVGAGTGGTVVRIIDCHGHFVIDSIFVGGGGTSMVTDDAKGKVYCSNINADKVDIIDARGDTLIKTIPLGRSPGALCWNRTNSRVYIADLLDNTVSVIRDTSTGVAEGVPPPQVRAEVFVARPNPFRRSTTIRCLHGADDQSRLQVCSLTGALERVLSGSGFWHWDGRDDRGRPAHAGVYVLRSPGKAGATLVVKTE
jgi:YVTN family beta-propeller protein